MLLYCEQIAKQKRRSSSLTLFDADLCIYIYICIWRVCPCVRHQKKKHVLLIGDCINSAAAIMYCMYSARSKFKSVNNVKKFDKYSFDQNSGFCCRSLSRVFRF